MYYILFNFLKNNDALRQFWHILDVERERDYYQLLPAFYDGG